LIFIFAAIFFTQKAFADGDKVRILFIGNSLTTANDLPGMLVHLAKSRHHELECNAYAPVGYHLNQHAFDSLLALKINQGKWDFVVLQEQSQEPAFSPEQVGREVYFYAKKLCELIKSKNPGAKIIFYMTMANKNGDRRNIAVSPELGTYEGTQRRVNKSYITMARDNHALIAPVGEAWQVVRRRYPEVELYTDETHPNPTGTYLAACVFFSTIFNEKVSGLSHPGFINDKIARHLQEIVDKVAGAAR
jgi:hypothetical protein